MTLGIIIYGDDRRIVAIDDAAALLFAKPSQELLRRNLTDFVPKPDREQLAAARATLERNGQASGRYALEREDGHRVSITYSVLANAPLPGLNLMVISPSDAQIASDDVRVRQVGQDVYPGLEVSEDDRWHGIGQIRRHATQAPHQTPGHLVAAVFPTEEDGWAALLEVQHRIEPRFDIALSAFDGGWPRDPRSVLVARSADGHLDSVAAVVAAFGGTHIAAYAHR